MMKIKLHWKLTLIFCLAVIFGLFTGYFYLTSQLKTYIERGLEDHLRHQLLSGRDLLEEELKQNKASFDPQNLARRIGQQQQVRVTIIKSDGTVVGDSNLNALELKKLENHLHRPEIQQSSLIGFGLNKRYSTTIKKYLLYMAVPFGREHRQGFLRYAVTISSIELLEGQIQKMIAGALLLVFLLSLAFTYIISLVVSKPLNEMAKIARAMAYGDFSHRPSIFYSNDEIGDLSRALSYMSDEIKWKMEQIKLESVKLDAVLSSMFEGIMVVDERGKILLMNPSLRKFFFVDSVPESKTPIEVIRNAQIQDVVDRILKDKQKLITQEMSTVYPQEQILRINAAPIIRNDIFEGAVLVFHDITELRRLERVRQDFVANVSHELRTPISSIKGYAETLLDGAMADKDNLKEFINIIHQDSNRLANLIDDLLDLAKIESGKMNIVLSPVDIRPILDRTLRVLDKLIKTKKLSISVDTSSNLPKILADDKRLAQVFLNLLDNAVKYTPEGGSIKVRFSVNDQAVVIDVADTGIGIPEKDIPRIFERFYRVDKARSRELGGTGLGLSIVKHIVLAHNGQVSVRSELGLGSVFSFFIPRA
ncbi:MAG: HAMP domain-containing protein [Candidatus Omnitrophica bacterium]|nr:HAMP domain-containing protein [Candidatus Omnitrophota bacterium]